ncbi:hypothetical protein BT93_H2961 [Corymbia citriodora subsp. variegata]|nr:hypothetical protein BT93_H2961 [Corymbia citriodora subsp. variegata]
MQTSERGDDFQRTGGRQIWKKEKTGRREGNRRRFVRRPPSHGGDDFQRKKRERGQRKEQGGQRWRLISGFSGDDFEREQKRGIGRRRERTRESSEEDSSKRGRASRMLNLI